MSDRYTPPFEKTITLLSTTAGDNPRFGADITPFKAVKNRRFFADLAFLPKIADKKSGSLERKTDLFALSSDLLLQGFNA